MTAAEARQKMAAEVLAQTAVIESSIRHRACLDVLNSGNADEADRRLKLLIEELRLIETWLRRRAVGQDRILTRQMEKPTGGKVGMGPKQARKMGIPDASKP